MPALLSHRIDAPALPAVANYPAPSPWDDQLAAARERFLELVDSDDGWTKVGDKQGVRLCKKYEPGSPHPLVRGTTLVENVSPYTFFAGTVQAEGMRKLWDDQYVSGLCARRYSQQSILFHVVAKGVKMIASPRDIAGAQRDYIEEDGSFLTIEISVETSIIPEQPKMTRATMSLSGWRFKPLGPHTLCTNILQVAVNGSIPTAIANMVATDAPMCVAAARKAYYKFGYAPHLAYDPKHQSTMIFQTDDFFAKSKRYECIVITGQPGDYFEIAYDLERMYSAEGRVHVSIEGTPQAASAEDNGKGRIRIIFRERGKTITVVVVPQ